MCEINRESIKQNTLINEITRLDFYTLENFEEILEKVQKNFVNHGYMFSQHNNYNVNYEVDDPEPLITETFMLKKKVDIVESYEFMNVNEGCRFVINPNMLLFIKNDFSSYEGIDKYFEIFFETINIINEVSKVNVSRIGIRKINELILSSKIAINKYFKSDYFYDLRNDKEDTKELVLEYSYKPFYEKDISMNKNIRIMQGKYKLNDKNKTAYSFMWDLDCYKRYNDDFDINKLKDTFFKINDKIFTEYKNVISEKLATLLTSNSKSNDIYGGLNGKKQ